MFIIKVFDQANVKVVKLRALALLAPLQVEFGVIVVGTTGSFERNECSVSFKLLLPVNEDLEAKQFRERAPLHGIPADLLWKEFSTRNETYKLIGYRCGTGKNPLTKPFIVTVGNEEHLVSPSFLKRLLAETDLLPETATPQATST
jgi:hypothetical protein